MYKRLTSNMRPGPDLLQKVPTLVLNVDFLMIMSVKGPVGSIYCKQSMFLSLLMIFCSYTPVKCNQVLIYCRQCHSCPECWLSYDYACQGTCGTHLLQTVNVLVLVDDLLSYRLGTVTYKSSLRFTHIVCVCVICPVQIFMKGCFCDGVCVSVFVSRT